MDRLPEVPPELEQLYYHEAGHAVAAFVLEDAKFENIEINAIETCGVVNFDNNANHDKKKRETRTDITIPEITNRIIINCSGDAAEFLFTGHKCNHDSSDNADSYELLARFCPKKKIPGYIEEIWNIALHILKQPQNWFAVKELAGCIRESYTEPQNWNDDEFVYDYEYDEENRELSGDKVRRIIIEALELYPKLQKRKKVYYRG